MDRSMDLGSCPPDDMGGTSSSPEQLHECRSPTGHAPPSSPCLDHLELLRWTSLAFVASVVLGRFERDHALLALGRLGGLGRGLGPEKAGSPHGSVGDSLGGHGLVGPGGSTGADGSLDEDVGVALEHLSAV